MRLSTSYWFSSFAVGDSSSPVSPWVEVESDSLRWSGVGRFWIIVWVAMAFSACWAVLSDWNMWPYCLLRINWSCSARVSSFQYAKASSKDWLFRSSFRSLIRWVVGGSSVRSIVGPFIEGLLGIPLIVLGLCIEGLLFRSPMLAGDSCARGDRGSKT